MNTQDVIHAISQKIAQEFKPEKIILFGSYAWGTPGPDSDVDLFIVKETANTRQQAREIDGYIFPRKFAMDLIVYTPEGLKRGLAKKDFFIHDIITKGKILYERT